MQNIKISIIILTHNAPYYVIKTLNSLSKTKNIDYETIVVDNKSRFITKLILFLFFNLKHIINRLLYVDENTLFSKGNNIGVKNISNESTHILLLNSDVRINNPIWLEKLLTIHEFGATSFGVTTSNRADGFCFLLDKELYLEFQLDEFYEHWWSLTKLQSEILKRGYKVKAVKSFPEYITHFAKKSGKIKQKIRTASPETVSNWFKDLEVEIIEKI